MEIDTSIFNDYKNPDIFLFPENQLNPEYVSEDITIPPGEDLTTPDMNEIFEQNVRTLEQIINEVNTTLTNSIAALKTSLLNQISGVNSSLSGTISENYQEYFESLSQIQNTLDSLSHQTFTNIPEQVSLNAQAIEDVRTDFIDNLENVKNLLETQTNSLISSIQANIDDVNYQLAHNLNLSSTEISDLIDNEIEALKNNLITSVETINVAIVSGDSVLNARMAELTESITAFGNQVVDFIDPNKITYIEANNLNLAYIRIIAEAEDIIDIAVLLNILNERVAFQTALSNLHSTLSDWIEQSVENYPIAISDSDRTLIEVAFEDVESVKSVLVNTISRKQAEGFNVSLSAYMNYAADEFNEITDSLSTLNNQITTASSDNYISLSEANALKLSLIRVMAESDDILDLATASDVTTEKTAYQNAISNLQNVLSTWIDKSTYPLAITETHRTLIIDAFALIETTKTTLSTKITQSLDTASSVNLSNYINEQINQVLISVDALDSVITSYSSDLQITAIEANNLNLLFEQVNSESEDLINAATSLDITAEKSEYSTTLAELSTLLNRWIHQPSYPVSLTISERQDIVNKFKNVQDKKSILINAVRNKQNSNTNASIVTLNQTFIDSFVDVNISLVNLSTEITNISSDTYITLAESESLKLSLNRLISESNDIIALANSISSTIFEATKIDFDFKLTAYSASINNLSGLLNQWINQAKYPKDITETDRINITNAFTLVESNKTALSTSISQILNDQTVASVNSYVDNQLLAVTSSLSGLEATVSAYSSDLQITSIEVNNLKILYEQLLSESSDLILAATTIGITAEKLAYSTALSELTLLINAWIYRENYPLNITANERQDIINKFKTVQNKKSILVNAIRDKQVSNLSVDITNVNSIVSTSFTDITTSLNNLTSQFLNIISDESVSLIEANILDLSLQQISSESADILTLATTISNSLTGTEKTIFDTKLTNYANAIVNISGLLSPWINQPHYPVSIITPQRIAIVDAFNLAQSTKSILSGAITEALNTRTSLNLTNYIDEQMIQVNSSVASLESFFTSFSSDTQISSIEANTLKLQLEQLSSESIDLVNAATLMGVTAEKLAYSTSLAELSESLSRWINKLDYPLYINLTERQDIVDKFKNVQNAKSILINSIRNKQASTIVTSIDTLTSLMNTSFNDVNTILTSLDTQITNISSDEVITFTESESLKLSLNQLISESSDVLSIASSISSALSGATKTTFDTKLTNYSTAITNLNSLLIQWINQSNYPKTISGTDRTNITAAFQAVQNTKSILNNAVTQSLDTNNNQTITNYINDQISDVNMSLTSFSDQLALYASDGALTLAEANALKLSFSQIQSESTAILNEATLIGVNTIEKTNYQTALATLAILVNPWVDLQPINGVSQYPITINNTQRIALKDAFTQVQSTKTILLNAIKTKQIDVNVASLNFQIETSASNLGTQVNNLSTEFQGAIDAIHNDLFLEIHQRESLATVVEQYNNTLKGSILSTQAQALTGIGNVTSNTALNLALLRQDLESQLGSQVSNLSAQMTEQGVAINATIAQHVDNLNNRVSVEVDNLQNTIEVKTTTLTDGIDVIQTDLINGFYEANISISDLQDSWKKRIADARVVWDSKTRIGLESQVTGNIGAIFVQEELIIGDSSVDVYNTSPVLNLISHDSSNLIASCIQPNTEYYIYLANHDREEFNITEIAATETTPLVEARDCRGKLFLSTTPDYNGYMGSVFPGISARVVGQVNTDSTPYSQGGPFFIRELNISWIAKDVSLPETYHEHCDFTLDFENETTLVLTKVDGLYGQVFVGGELIVIDSSNRSLTTDKIRITWTVGADSPLGYVDDAILGDAIYQVYLGDDSDAWNFNDINPNTGKPWQVFDDYAILFYDPDFDLRKSIFLSSKDPEHGYLSEQYPGYLARYLGQIETDISGYFKYSPKISAIRSLQLDPTYLDDLANIEILDVSSSTFKIIKKRGTSGIIKVGGVDVFTYAENSPDVHTVTLFDIIYYYNEGNPLNSLQNSQEILNTQLNKFVHVYITNDRSCWNTLTNKVFLTLQEPAANAYLSENYPGYNARWIAKLKLSIGTTGPELLQNGIFASSDNWTWGSGWSWSNLNQNAYRSSVQGNYATVATPVNSSDWTTLYSANITQSTPGDYVQSKIYHVVSFDSGITWKVFKSSQWISIVRNNNNTWQYLNNGTWTNASPNTRQGALQEATNQSAYQWQMTDIHAMSNANWIATNGWSTSVDYIYWDVFLIDGYTKGGDGSDNPSTTNVTSSVTITAKSSASGFATPSTLMDGNLTNAYESAIHNGYPQWIKVDYGEGNARIINKIGFYVSDYFNVNPKSWTIQGTNIVDHYDEDDDDWETLGEIISPNTKNTWLWGVVINYTAYRYYRLRIDTSWGGLGYIGMSEIRLVEAQLNTEFPSFTKVFLAAATGTPAALSQTGLTIEANKPYQIWFDIASNVSGYLTPLLGNVAGESRYSANNVIQTIKAEAASTFYLVPSMDFAGEIDRVSVREVIEASFSGTYIRDSIIVTTPIIDNDSLGPAILWSSQKIIQVIQEYMGTAAAAAIFSTQQVSGLNAYLQYVNNTTVRLAPMSTETLTIAFPNSTTCNLAASGEDLIISGNKDIRHYVYLSQDNGLWMTTAAPDTIYSQLETLGTSNILVGEVAMTNTNTMSGNWNVCSSHRQEYLNNNLWNPAKSASTIISLPNLVLTKRYDITSSFNGTVTYTFEGVASGFGSTTVQASVTGTGTAQSPWSTIYTSVAAYGTYRCYLTVSTGGLITSGVEGLNTIYATYAETWTHYVYNLNPSAAYTFSVSVINSTRNGLFQISRYLK